MRNYLVIAALISGAVSANPQGETVVSGEASFYASESGLTVEQHTQDVWIDWESFSIGADEWVRIEQLSEAGLSVNRVVGNEVSEIFGQLSSNGTVYLVNPNGLLFGESSQVDVGQLFATDHWLEADGALTPSTKNSAGIRVLGQLNSRTDLTLLAERVVTSGELVADNIELLGSQGALLHLDEHGSVSVLVPANAESESWVENTGAIIANGNLYLGSAQKNDWLNQLAAESHVNVAGTLNAQSINLQGSHIELMDAELSASLIDIESQQTTYIGQSSLSAIDEKIRIRGENIQLHSNTLVDVGSGELTIGGYYQGQGDDNNAKFVHVSSSVHLYGNGGDNGNGGEIILWSDGTTSFHGSIETEGGRYAGDGGFVEVSGKETLVFRGRVSTQATNGDMGLLLLDPDTITIADGAGASADTDGTVGYTDYNNQDITIYEADLEAIAAGTSIDLRAEETITINDLSDGALTFNQTGSVNFNVANSAGEARFEMLDTTDAIEMTGGGNLGISLFGNTAISSPAQTATMIVGDVNFTSGGSLNFQATTQGSGTTTDEITISVQDITITGDGTVTLAINNAEDTDVGSTQIDVGNITISGTTGANNVSIIAGNNNLGAATAGTSIVNLNGDLNISGTGHTVDITTEEDAAVGGTINSYGDIFANGSTITLSTNTWELLDADTQVEVISMSNFAGGGGGIDLTDLSVAGVDGNGNSLTIAGSGNHNLDWNEFTNLNFLIYRTDVDVTLGVDGATSLSNAELALVDAAANRLTIQSAGNITTSNATIATQLALRADRDSNGSGSVILNGLNTTNTNLTISGADISGDGTATTTGTGTITFDTHGNGQSMSVNGSETYNIEAAVWNNLSSSAGVTLTGVSGGNQIFFEHGSLGLDVTIDGSGGAGVVIDGAAKTYAGANSMVLIGDVSILTNVAMTNAASVLDINGTLAVGEVNAAGGDTVTIEGNWETSGITSITLEGDAGDTVALTHINDTDFSVSNVSSANTVNLDLTSNGSVTASNLTAGDLLINYDNDNDESGSTMLTLSGTNAVNGFTLFGSNSNDDATWGGTWTIAGDVNVFQTNLLNLSSDNISANSINLTGVNTTDFGSGTAHTLTSTVGNISLGDFTSDRRVNVDSAGALSINAITTSNNRVDLTATDITGDGSAINVGTARLTLQVQSGANTLSIGDAGTETFNVEANIWDSISAGSLVLDTIGSDDTITFLEDTLPTNLSIDGPTGTLTFDGIAQNFIGATLATTTDVVFRQDFSSDSLVDIDGDISIGASNAGAGDSVTITGDFDFSGAGAFDLLGDTGDTVFIDHNGSSALALPVSASANGDPTLNIDSDRSLTMAGFEGGTLTIAIDSNNNSTNFFNTTGTYVTDGLSLTGTGNNDSATIDGTWTIDGSVAVFTLPSLTFVNDSFVASGSLSLPSNSTLTLGSSTTAFTLGATTGNVIFGDISGNRPVTISAAGSISGSYLDAASRDVNLTSDADASGDEAIVLTNLRAGNLDLNGDFDWTFSPVLSGDYRHLSGDVSLTDVTLSGFSVDLTSANSITLSGTLNTLEARSGDVSVLNALDDGSNAGLILQATGAISATGINTGTGNLTLDADTNDSGGEVVTLTDATAGAVTFSSDGTLAGTNALSSLTTTQTLTFNNSNLTIDSLDNSTWGGLVLSGSNNSITASNGSITLTSAVDSGSNAGLSLSATGSLVLSNLNTGLGDLALNSDADTTGLESINLTDSSGGGLILSDDAQLAGVIRYSNISSTSAIAFSLIDATLDDFDSTNFSSVSFSGSSNSLSVGSGNLVLDTPTLAADSMLSLSVGAGTHRLDTLNIADGAIEISAVSGSVNQNVTAEGDWTFETLSVTGIDTFNSSAQLTANDVIDVQTTNDITLNDGSLSTGETINLNAGDDLTVTGLSSDSMQIPSVRLTAGGDLLDGGDSTDDVSVFWLDSIRYDIQGETAALDTRYSFAVDIADAGSEIAAISEPSITTIEDENESKNPLDGNDASVGSLPKSRVDVFLPQCSGNNKNCRKTNAIRKFLSALLIGGAIPE